MARDGVLLVSFFLSGAAALGYELLWTRLLSLGLGSETLGILAVLTGFFSGMALGAWWLHDRARKSPNPVKLFVILELVAALFAAISPYWLFALARWLPPILGPWAGDNDTPFALFLSLGVATVSILPATVCLGGTLAALVEARRRAFRSDPEGVGLGRLYAANTLGATAGVLTSVFVLMPRLGLPGAARVLCLVGLAAAGLAFLWGARRRASLEALPLRIRAGALEAGILQEVSSPGSRSQEAPKRGLLRLLFFTGLAGVGLEVVVVQVLRQTLEDTVYSFAALLAVYLLGTGLGAAAYSRFAPRISKKDFRRTTAGLLLLQAAATLVAGFLLQAVPALLVAVAPEGSSGGWRLATEFLAAAAVFVPPTLVMGALFSHLLAQIAHRGVGRAYAINTLGGTLAPFLFGVGLVQLFGYRWAFAAVVLLYGALFVTVADGASRFRPRTALAAVALLLTTVLALPSLVLVGLPDGWREVFRAETLHGLVLVSELPPAAPGQEPLRQLQVDRQFRMGGILSFGERRMGQIPLLLSPGAREALFLGVGTGATLGAVRHFPLTHVDAVELIPAVLEALPAFEGINEEVFRHGPVSFHAADARRFVRASSRSYDVVVGDLFHPARDGAGGLYSREHFEAVRDHLSRGGLFVQWVPLYQLDEGNLRTIVRTFLAVFPEAHSFLGLYNATTPAFALAGRRGDANHPLSIPLDRLERKLRDPVYESLLMDDVRDFFAAYLLDREALTRFAGTGPLNTDLEPRVLFDAPASAYEGRRDLGAKNLETLLTFRTPYPEELVSHDGPDSEARKRELRDGVLRFSTALGLYLQGEILRATAGEGGLVPADAVDAYLRAYEAEPEFPAARGILLSLARSDGPLAAQILPRMLARNPEEPRSRQLQAEVLQARGKEGAPGETP